MHDPFEVECSLQFAFRHGKPWSKSEFPKLFYLVDHLPNFSVLRWPTAFLTLRLFFQIHQFLTADTEFDTISTSRVYNYNADRWGSKVLKCTVLYYHFARAKVNTIGVTMYTFSVFQIQILRNAVLWMQFTIAFFKEPHSPVSMYIVRWKACLFVQLVLLVEVILLFTVFSAKFSICYGLKHHEIILLKKKISERT